MLGPTGMSSSRWYTPDQYVWQKGLSGGPDAIIIGQTGKSLEAIFLEIKSPRPRKQTQVSGDLELLKIDWTRFLIGSPRERKEARQLDQAVTDFRNSKFSLPGIDQNTVATIYPIIVTLDQWPFSLKNYQAFAEDVRAEGLLRQPQVMPIDIWSCFDFETLCSRVISGGQIFQIVRHRSLGEDYLPLWFQLNLGGSAPGPNSPTLEKSWDKLRDAMVADLGLKEE
jgi:hypothetical protein